MNIDGGVSFAAGVCLLHSIDSFDEPDLQVAHSIEHCILDWLAANSWECARDADAGVCDRSIGFSIDVTSNILSIYTMIGLVVSIAARRALIAVLAIFFSFTRNVSLLVCSISALVTLIVAVLVVVSGHF
jgi:hypothetical protein